MPVFRLAWTEFSLPFRHLRSGVPGGRDFLWLTSLLMLVLTLGLLLQATRVGLLERFVDVFLGTVEEHGVPVWVIPNPISKGSIKFISNDVIKDVENEGLRIFPYREIDSGFSPVELPSRSIWKTKSEFAPKFSGWAVYLNDPLWPESKVESGKLPLKIVINRALFQKHFDHRKYNEVMRNKISGKLFSEITDEQFLSLRPTEHLWLNIRSGNRSSLQKFEVTWRERIPTIRKIVFLFPMATYHALNEASNYPELRYFPEYSGDAGFRLKRITVSGDLGHKNFNKFLATTNGKASQKRGRTVVAFRSPQNKFLIEDLLADMKLTYRALEVIHGHQIIDRKMHVELPCEVIPRRELKKLKTIRTGNSQCGGLKDVTSAGNGFLRAFIYVPDRTTLNSAVKRSLEIHDQALSIHPIYRDALNRFGFLTKIIDVLRWPYGIILLLFLISVLGIQIGTLVDHRRGRYGIFLAKGVNWFELYQMLYIQIGFASIIGVVGASIINSIIKQAVSKILTSTTQEFQDTLNITNFEILPFAWIDYALVTFGAFVLAQCFATIILYRLPINSRTEIGPMLQN
jgi:hypothetical protein